MQCHVWIVTYYSFTLDTNCAVGFIPFEDIQKASKLITSVSCGSKPGYNIFFKDIKFNCTGEITHVIIGATENLNSNLSNTDDSPEIRIWRKYGNGYAQSGPSVKLYYNQSTPDKSSVYLRWYNFFKPVSVKQEDLFGLYQPAEDDAASFICHQHYSGPVAYSNFQQMENNYYDLVSVVLG